MPSAKAFRLSAALLFAASFFVPNLYGQRAAGQPAESAADAPRWNLSQRVRQAKGGYRPITSDVLQQARQSLASALQRQQRWLAPQGANGTAWQAYLYTKELSEQLNAGNEPDVRILRAILARYTSGAVGLELEPFADVTRALRTYADRLAAAAEADAATQFDRLLDVLADNLDILADAKSDADQRRQAQRMSGQVLGWLARHGQAAELTRAVEAACSQPNLLVQVAAPLIAGGLGRPIDNTEPVTDYILGTSISGTGHTLGQVQARLLPNSDYAVVETVLTGTNYSRTVGRNGPARIYSDGQTELEGRKWIYISQSGVQTAPAWSRARTRTRITGIGSAQGGILGHLVRKIAAARAPQQKSQGERIAARHAEERFSRRIDEDAGVLLARANQGFIERFRNPLVRRGEFPRLLRFHTTADDLHVTVLQNTVGYLGAPGAPPALDGRHALAVRVHESLVNNAAQGLLAGQTIDQRQLQLKAEELLGYVPDRLIDDEQREPWSLTFADRDPVTLVVSGNEVALTLRGQRYSSGDRRFDAMNFTLRYRLEPNGRGLRATRIGEFEILPPGFVPGSGQRLALRQTLLVNLIRKRLTRMLDPVIESHGLELDEPWNSGGALLVRQLVADNGWLALGWQQESADAVAGSAAARR